MLRALSRLFRRTARSFGPNRIYRSPLDAAKAVMLRIRAEKPNKSNGPLPARRSSPWKLRLRNLEAPVYLRPAASDYLVLRDLFEDHEYGPVRQFNLPPDPTILDLGGNIGLSVRYFLSLYPSARIAVAEPDDGNFEMLRQNCRDAIAAAQVIPIRAFAAAADGQAQIDRSDQPWGFKKRENDPAAPPAGESEMIPCHSLPTLLQMAEFARVDLLKVDIEGAERELFADCRDWIGHIRTIAIETHAPYAPQDFYHALQAAGWPYRIVHEIPYTPAPRIFVERAEG